MRVALKSEGKPNPSSREMGGVVLSEAVHSGSGAMGGTGDGLSHRKKENTGVWLQDVRNKRLKGRLQIHRLVAYRERRQNNM